ncbi:gamma-glutamyl-gamma-aminobutyrate hydrolase family protein [Dongia sp.]|uniref:gamma-glutamyl-gamma-aminobutyrate hydrolase family protein n=1 Tax=Dongia sp. TaxID=1977262 RepID=UPI00375042FC
MTSRRVAISQRVEFLKDRNERRDSLDQRWSPLLASCGLLPVPIPNAPDSTDALLAEFDPAGVILSGGGDLSSQGADAADRDAVERKLVDWARSQQRPILAVCRGMQHLLTVLGAELVAVTGHVAVMHPVRFADGSERAVNSFHNWGFRGVPVDFDVIGIAADDTIEAARHRREPILCVMWHPERMSPFAPEDQDLLQKLFGTRA